MTEDPTQEEALAELRKCKLKAHWPNDAKSCWADFGFVASKSRMVVTVDFAAVEQQVLGLLGVSREYLNSTNLRLASTAVEVQQIGRLVGA